LSAPAERFEWLLGRVRAGEIDGDAVVEGFAPSFLESVPAPTIVDVLARWAPRVAGPERSRAEAGDRLQVCFDEATVQLRVEPAPPHRFLGLLFRPAGRLDDARLDDAPWTVEGDADGVLPVLRAEFRTCGLVGLVAAGFEPGRTEPAWAVAGGFRDIDAAEPAGVGDRMLAGSVSKLLAATAVLVLVADGVVALDDSANVHLRSLRLTSDAVTIHHLLTHTAGVPSEFEHFLVEAPESAASVLGEVVEVEGTPGTSRIYSNGGYAVLGEVIAGATGRPVRSVIAERVLEPLGMGCSSLAVRWPADVGPGYDIDDSRPVAVERKVPSVPCAGGLCTTVADLGRFVGGWASLLPADLAASALAPHAERDFDGQQGFGWLLSTGPGGDRVAGHSGGVMGFSASVLWLPDRGVSTIAMTNRAGPAETVNAALLAAWVD
jgi:CubicO group peptidase (beta-lactamase class C family)